MDTAVNAVAVVAAAAVVVRIINGVRKVKRVGIVNGVRVGAATQIIQIGLVAIPGIGTVIGTAAGREVGAHQIMQTIITINNGVDIRIVIGVKTNRGMNQLLQINHRTLHSAVYPIIISRIISSSSNNHKVPVSAVVIRA